MEQLYRTTDFLYSKVNIYINTYVVFFSILVNSAQQVKLNINFI